MQLPPSQTALAPLHAFPHPPQWALSRIVSAHVPKQSVRPGPHELASPASPCPASGKAPESCTDTPAPA